MTQSILTGTVWPDTLGVVVRLSSLLLVVCLVASCMPESESPALVASGEHVRLSGEYEENRALWVPSDGGAGVELQTLALGRPDRMQSVQTPRFHANGQDAFYQYEHLDVWFQATPTGVRQGFTVASPPDAERGVLAVDVRLVTSRTIHDRGDSLLLRDALGQGSTLTYRNARAWDSRGVPLDTTLSLSCDDEGCVVRLSVDDRAAVYPVVIDPDGEPISCQSGYTPVDGDGNGIDNACVHPSATVHSTATLMDAATVGPNAVVEAGAVLERMTLVSEGASLGLNAMLAVGSQLESNTSIGSNSVVGRWVELGGDGALGEDAIIDGQTSIGDQLAADVNGFVVGYNSTVGDRLTVLGDGVVVGNHVEFGDDVTLGAGVTITSDAQIGSNVTIGAGTVLGRGVTVGANTEIGANGHIRKGAVLGADMVVEDNVRIGRDFVGGDGTTIREGTQLRANVQIGGCADIDPTIAATLRRGDSLVVEGVDCLDDGPVAEPDFVQFVDGETTGVFPLDNDYHPNGRGVLWVSYSTASGVAVSGDMDGLYFTPDASTPDSFTIEYIISDVDGLTADGVITANRSFDDGVAPVLDLNPTVSYDMLTGGTYAFTGTVIEDSPILSVICTFDDGSDVTLSPINGGGSTWTISEDISWPLGATEMDCVASDGLYASETTGHNALTCEDGVVADNVFVSANYDTGWNDPHNWIPGGVPEAGANVHICAQSTATLSSNVSVNDLTIGSRAAILGDSNNNISYDVLITGDVRNLTVSPFQRAVGLAVLRMQGTTQVASGWLGTMVVETGDVVMDSDLRVSDLQILRGASVVVGPHTLQSSGDTIVRGSALDTGLVMRDPAGLTMFSDATFTDGHPGTTGGNLTAGTLEMYQLTVSAGIGSSTGLQPTGTLVSWPEGAWHYVNMDTSVDSWLDDVELAGRMVVENAPLRINGQFDILGIDPVVGDLHVYSELPNAPGTDNPWVNGASARVAGTVTVMDDLSVSGDLTTHLDNVSVPVGASLNPNGFTVDVVGNYTQTVAAPGDGLQLHTPSSVLRVQGDANFYGGSSLGMGGAITSGELRIARRLVESSNGFGNALNPSGGTVVFEENVVDPVGSDTTFAFANPQSSALHDVDVLSDVELDGYDMGVYGLMTVEAGANVGGDYLHLDATLPEVAPTATLYMSTEVHGDVVMQADWPVLGSPGLGGSQVTFVEGASLTPAGHTFRHAGDLGFVTSSADDGLQMLNPSDRVIFDYFGLFETNQSAVTPMRLQTGTIEVNVGLSVGGAVGSRALYSSGTAFSFASSGGTSGVYTYGQASAADQRLGAVTVGDDTTWQCPNGLPVSGAPSLGSNVTVDCAYVTY